MQIFDKYLLDYCKLRLGPNNEKQKNIWKKSLGLSSKIHVRFIKIHKKNQTKQTYFLWFNSFPAYKGKSIVETFSNGEKIWKSFGGKFKFSSFSHENPSTKIFKKNKFSSDELQVYQTLVLKIMSLLLSVLIIELRKLGLAKRVFLIKNVSKFQTMIQLQ